MGEEENWNETGEKGLVKGIKAGLEADSASPWGRVFGAKVS